MNRSGLLFLFFAIAVAGIFTWLNSTWLTIRVIDLTQKVKQIDYYLSDFILLNTYPNGEKRYYLKGQHLIHQQVTGATKIFTPSLQVVDEDSSSIFITSVTAQQDKKNGPITLVGDVNVNKENSASSKGFKLVTNDLVYNPLQRELYTDAEVKFDSKYGQMQGVGFITNLNEQELRINKDVQAEYIPAK